jgi:two-component system CheB/CheR fusion protein
MIHPQSGELNLLIEFLRRSRRFDFSGYKQASLMRRIEKRMRAVRVSSYAHFIDYLEVHPDEFPQLFNTILVNITSFFRDSAAWDRVVSDVVPQLLASKTPDQSLRVWSAGCASGQEAYTLAMVLAEALGRQQCLKRVKIFATDIDDEALAQARKGSYKAGDVAGVPPDLLGKYFTADGERIVFDAELRHVVAFGRHNLIRDAPISRIDLLSCRNTLMYFDAETQSEVLRRLHAALADGAVLFLGRAEMLLEHAIQFTSIDAKRRLFRKIPKESLREPVELVAPSETPGVERPEPVNALQAMLLASGFESCPAAIVILDMRGLLLLANERARALFRVDPRDVGRPFRDLGIAHLPVALGPLIEHAYSEGRVTILKDVQHATASGEMYFDVRVLPLCDAAVPLGVEVGFFDVTPYRPLQLEPDAVKVEIEPVSAAPQSASDGFDSPAELRSALTELEIVNAELLSTSEQLQSTNQELKTMNDEMRAQADDRLRESAFLKSFFESFRGGIVVVDCDLVVQVWNRRAEALCGLRSHEAVGKYLLNLGLGLPVETLRGAIRSCLVGESEYVEIVAPRTTRRGRSIRCRVTCMPLVRPDARAGVILLIDKEARKS